LDDQRCSLPGTTGNPNHPKASNSSPSKAVLQEVLKHPPPYPSIVLPPQSGLWIENKGNQARWSILNLIITVYNKIFPEDDVGGQNEHFDIQSDEITRAYRTHFMGYEHYNFCGTDEHQVSKNIAFILNVN